MWVMLTSLFVAAVMVTSIVFAVRAADTARTPQGAVGWVVFLIAAPYLAIPAYLFLGHSRYYGYVIGRRESKRIMDALRVFRDENAPEPGSLGVAPGPFEDSAELPVVRGNGADLLIDGQATFDAIFAAIDAAETYVLAQFYIVHDDDLGRTFQERLIAAARRGVTVRLMVDAVGSLRLPESYSHTLRQAGVEVVDRETTRGPRFRFQLNFRNHRKTVIVDGTTGFIGGLNVGDEYMGRDPKFGHWRDTHLKIAGPMVSQLQLIFAEDWHWGTEEVLLDDLNWQAGRDPRDMNGLIVATGPGDASETGSMMYFAAIAEAKERVWIASPYFVPDLDVITALRHAALRGVDVRLLVPGMADHKVTWLAAFSYFDMVMDAGVKVYRYKDGFMHQKAFLVDDSIAAVGTTNMDNRSFRLNFEAMALLFDTPMCGAVETMLLQDFAQTEEQTLRLEDHPAYVRWGAPVARLFSPLL